MLPEQIIVQIQNMLKEISEKISEEFDVCDVELRLAALQDIIKKRELYVPLTLWSGSWWREAPFLLSSEGRLHRWFALHVTYVDRTHVRAAIACMAVAPQDYEPLYYNSSYTREEFLKIHGCGDPEVGDFLETGFYHDKNSEYRRHTRTDEKAKLVLITAEEGVTEALHIVEAAK